jgi:hypothetical protein
LVISNSFDKLSKTSAETLQPVFVFFHFGKFNLSKSIIQTCFGEFILNSSQAILYISFSNIKASFSKIIQSSFNLSLEILTPVNSIFFNISIKGKSISSKISFCFLSNFCHKKSL